MCYVLNHLSQQWLYETNYSLSFSYSVTIYQIFPTYLLAAHKSNNLQLAKLTRGLATRVCTRTISLSSWANFCPLIVMAWLQLTQRRQKLAFLSQTYVWSHTPRSNNLSSRCATNVYSSPLYSAVVACRFFNDSLNLTFMIHPQPAFVWSMILALMRICASDILHLNMSRLIMNMLILSIYLHV